MILVYAALKSGSVALAGFGLDSLVEIFASVVVVWELKKIKEHSQRRAMKMIGIAFMLLATYIAAQSITVLLSGFRPQPSSIGIIWTLVTFIAMLLLAFSKMSVGKKLDNAVLQTEGRVTLIDAYLAAAVLIGIILNPLLGWWWADPLAGFVIVFYGYREGWAAIRG